MLAQTQESIAGRIAALQRARSTDLAPASYRQPPRDYTDPAVLALEMQRLFQEGAPLPAGLSCDARAPGDWFVYEALGRSVLVCRHADGSLRAYRNTCRHRGMRLAQGCGTGGGNFVCPYHAWAYDFEGCLRARPGEDSFADAPRSELGLQPLPVREEAGVVYVGLAPAQWPQAPLLGGAEAELAPFGLAGYHRIDHRVFQARMNWKLGIDSFLEAYHLHKLHRNTLRTLFLDDIAVFDAFGRNSRITGVRRSFEQHRTGDSLLPHLTVVYQLFPNAVLIHQQDHMEFYEALPDPQDPNRCAMRVTLYAPQAAETESALRYWAANLELVYKVTTTEDFAACEQIHANLRGQPPPFLVFGRNEPALIHFHRSLAQALA
ncbi:MAG: aromatic ring-hydroxylating dioxygenase subunit alpha [Nevskia sp.]|nr:aromatic ring-hydroxylating dioxygenase subunit alpha [Nevskia sp.]